MAELWNAVLDGLRALRRHPSGLVLARRLLMDPSFVTLLPGATGIVVGDDAGIGRRDTFCQVVTLGRRMEADEAYPIVSDLACFVERQAHDSSGG